VLRYYRQCCNAATLQHGRCLCLLYCCPRIGARNRSSLLAHAWRNFYDLHSTRPTLLTTEALRRIGELYAVEEFICDKSPDERRAARQLQAKPLLDDLKRWLHAMLATLSGKSDTAAVILYALKLWPALTRNANDGPIEIDNSAAERALRGAALNRRNFLFAGADSGGERCRNAWAD
jgi:transposase